jgi:peroxin-6
MNVVLNEALYCNLQSELSPCFTESLISSHLISLCLSARALCCCRCNYHYQDVASRAQILSAQTRKFKLADDADLLEIAGALPVTVTGADIGAVTSTAYSRALRRKLDELRDSAPQVQSTSCSSASSSSINNERPGDMNSTANVSTRTSVSTAGRAPWALAAFVNSLPAEELTVFVRKEDFLEAARTLKPSVSAEELVHYEGLGAAFSDVGFAR